MITKHASRLIQILNSAAVDELAVIVATMHGASDMARDQGKTVVANCFRELEALAVLALTSGLEASGKTEELSSNGCEIEVPPGAVVQ